MTPIHGPPFITDQQILETQRFVNDLFGTDLQFPVYIIRTPDESATFMSVIGGDDSLRLRDAIHDFRGGGYLVKLHKNRADPVKFNSLTLHEVAHCFDPEVMPPLASWPNGVTQNFDKIKDDYWSQYPVNIISNFVPIYFHRPEFWRTAFHVWKRASLAGFDCDHRLLGCPYADHDAMRRVIENETIDQLYVPLWKVARRSVSSRFRRLFTQSLGWQ